MSANHEPSGDAGALSPQFHVAHHFDTADQQFESNRMGLWLFLVTEILFFGGLFCAFAVFRTWYFDAFVEAHHHLDKVMGAVNTVVLITSSLTMALAVRAAQLTQKKATTILLSITFICACIFLVVKYFEYSHKIHDGLLPGKAFAHWQLFAPDFFTNLMAGKEIVFHEGYATGAAGGLFFAVYFMMTGIHGLHVLIGMGLIAWVIVRNQKGHFSSRYYNPVENVGLYWHLVDLVWIYLFPLLYLVG